MASARKVISKRTDLSVLDYASAIKLLPSGEPMDIHYSKCARPCIFSELKKKFKSFRSEGFGLFCSLNWTLGKKYGVTKNVGKAKIGIFDTFYYLLEKYKNL